MQISCLKRLRRRAGWFARGEDGAIVVEFSLVLPLMVLFLVITIQGGKLMWTYQSVVAGVRDAGRYLARVTPVDICISGGSVSAMASKLKSIVEQDISGNDLLPAGVTVNSVTPSITCVAGTYRVSPAAVGTVSANLTIDLPMAGVLSMFGSNWSSITTDVSDKSRIFGQ